MKKGLVLEGGGLRGLFTAGVIDVMMENGIEYDGIVGVSAGACFGCNYKSRQIGRCLRYNVNFAHDPRYMGFKSLWKTGDLVSADFAYRTLPQTLDIFDFDTYKDNPTEFHLVCTDVDTGETVYKKVDEMDDNGLDWLRATASMPIVSRPVEIEGRRLLDGGISNSIPLEYFQKLGYERNVVVLTQPKGFFKTRTKLMPLFKVFCRKYPRIVEAMARRHEMYNSQLEYVTRQEQMGNTLLIYPETALPIGRTEQNTDKMHHVYQMGRQAALARLEELRDFLA